MAVTDHIVKLPMRPPKKARNFAKSIARQTGRSQHWVFEGYSQRRVLFPQSQLFLRWFIFGLSQGAHAGTPSLSKSQSPPLEELFLGELLRTNDRREALKLS